MQSPQTTNCNECKTLKCVLCHIEKKLEKLIRNKYNSEAYAATLYFDDNLYSILLRYKRIVERRIYNPKYPSSKYDTQDIISKVILYINK